jgi:hypothetical protein
MRRFLQLDGEFTATIEMVAEARLFLVSAATAMAKALRAAGATIPDDALLAVAEVHIRLAASLVQVNYRGARCHRRRRRGQVRADLPRTAGALKVRWIARNRTAASTGVARF